MSYHQPNSKTKLTNYNPYPTHKQVIIKGIRKDKSVYEIKCDEKIADLIIELNNINCRTMWSCQGDTKNIVPYIVISGAYLTKSRLEKANEIIRKYWGKKYYFIKTEVTCNGDISFSGFTETLFRKHFQHFKLILNDNNNKKDQNIK